MTMSAEDSLDLGLVLAPELFDAKLFQCSPAEVDVMDPQHRLLLERGYGSLHSAGYTRATLIRQTGVFLGEPSPMSAVL